jgi:peptidase E
MSNDQGTIVLMGSGELTTSMVEVHKTVLRRLGKTVSAVFVDTPAGFQLNADQIFQKAADYFERRVQQRLQLASFKAAKPDNEVAAEQTFGRLRKADYILIGPGSPTYALQQWQQSPIPNMMLDCLKRGGCLVAASAAALTVGISTLPVYEIYKVGQPLHWSDGLDLLGHFGFRLVVVPHWNNAEGGNHDTRFCFMGATRFEQLAAMLPNDAQILGLDEHTALIIDPAQPYAAVEGVGRVTVRSRGKEHVFNKGQRLPLSLLRGESLLDRGSADAPSVVPQPVEEDGGEDGDKDVWDAIHALADSIRDALEADRDAKVTGAVLELERLIWKSQKQLEEQNEMGAAREVMREMIALLASRLGSRPVSVRACVTPLVESLIDLRTRLREKKEWAAADAVRECLLKAKIDVTDTAQGATWRIVDSL